MSSTGDEGLFRANKLILCVAVTFVCYRIFSNVPQSSLFGTPLSETDFYATVSRTYFWTGLFVLLEMVVFLCFYRPWTALFTFRSRSIQGRTQRIWDAVGGFGLGIAGAVLSAPLLSGNRARLLLNAVFPEPAFSNSHFIGHFLLLSIIIPSATTMVFFGAVFRSLLACAKPLPSILATALLLAYLWPIFASFAVAVIFGLVTGVAFWRRNLASALVANIVMSVLATSLGLWFIWR